jgi:rabenosyn-5
VVTKAQLDEAHKVRRRLLDLFVKYDAAAKQIIASPSSSSTDTRVQTAMNQVAIQFLQINMLPLQSIPKILSRKNKNENGTKAGGINPAKEKELREKMMVLEEQKFLVENMIEKARKGRRMEEVAALRENSDDLKVEIDKIRDELQELLVD